MKFCIDHSHCDNEVDAWWERCANLEVSELPVNALDENS